MTPATMLDEVQLAETTAVLKALSEPNRLRIFATLMTGDSCNNELRDRLGLAPNLLSHHLRALEKAGLIEARRDKVDGRWIYYSVDREAAGRWQGCFAHFLDPARIQKRPVCGPEGQLIEISQIVERV